jgi:hypothetical protein
MAKTRDGKQSELMDILIARHWPDMFSEFTRDPATIKWVEA